MSITGGASSTPGDGSTSGGSVVLKGGTADTVGSMSLLSEEEMALMMQRHEGPPGADAADGGDDESPAGAMPNSALQAQPLSPTHRPSRPTVRVDRPMHGGGERS